MNAMLIECVYDRCIDPLNMHDSCQNERMNTHMVDSSINIHGIRV